LVYFAESKRYFGCVIITPHVYTANATFQNTHPTYDHCLVTVPQYGLVIFMQ